MTLIQKEIKRITIRPNGTEKQIRPSKLSYSVDFRNNSQANLEADGYSFIGRGGPSYGFDANGLAITSTGQQLAVGKYLNTSSFKTFTATITTQVNNNSDGGGTFVHTMPQGQNIWDGNHVWCLLYNAYGLAIQGTRYGTRPTTGEHTFTFIVNLDTGAASATDSGGQSVSTTLSATELTYIKGNNIFVGCLLDSNVHKIKTLDVLFE